MKKEKITFEKLCEIMREYNRKFPESQYSAELRGVIVYKQDNWSVPYTVKQRSYEVTNCNRAFQVGKISRSLFGNCLDGMDSGVRLDWYNWEVEYCYMEITGAAKSKLNAYYGIAAQNIVSKEE